MPSLARSLAGVALLATAASCHFDDLVDPPPTGVLVATPAAVSVSAAAGPGSPRPVTLSLTSAAHEPVSWTIARTGNGSWLTLQENEGSTPDTLHLSISAAGLAAGTYTDTLVITPDDPDQAVTRVPVTLAVAAGAERLAFRQVPTTTRAGEAITPAVTVAGVDRDGAVIATFQGTITLTLAGGPGGATLSGDVSASAVNGVATFAGLSLDKAGAGYALVASTPGMAEEASPAFAITPGAATRLAFTQQPTSTTPNTNITPAVTVTAYDGYGNVVTDFTASVTITLGHDGSVLGNANLGGTRTVSAAAGVARFADLTLDQIGGGYTLVANSTGLAPATSAAFDIAPLGGSASEQRFSQQPSNAQAGNAVTPAVEVTILDGLGDPVTTFTDPVTLALTGGTAGAVLGGTITAIPNNGVARFSSLMVDRAGTGYRLVAKTAGLPDITSDPFDITTTPPPTGTLTVATNTTGSGTDPDGYLVTVAGESRALPLNGSTTYTGLPAGAVTVTLSGLAGNCSIFGANPRSLTVIAGSTVSTTFDVGCSTVTPPPSATQLRFIAQPPSVALVGGNFTLSVAGLDVNGTLVPTFTGRVNLVLIGGLPGTVLSGTTGVDAVNGVATFNDLHVTGPCVGCRIQAGAALLVAATSDPFTIVVP